MNTGHDWTTTPFTAGLLRGALDLERTERGVLPHRLPAHARQQIPDGWPWRSHSPPERGWSSAPGPPPSSRTSWPPNGSTPERRHAPTGCRSSSSTGGSRARPARPRAARSPPAWLWGPHKLVPGRCRPCASPACRATRRTSGPACPSAWTPEQDPPTPRSGWRVRHTPCWLSGRRGRPCPPRSSGCPAPADAGHRRRTGRPRRARAAPDPVDVHGGHAWIIDDRAPRGT